MMQRLATRNADSVPLDFGLSIVFDDEGMRALGRADSPDYRGAIFEALTAADVTLSDVADDYAIPGPPAPPATGRDLTWDEFLDVGMATDPTSINSVLLHMPVVSEYGRKYLKAPGIIYADATTPGTRLKTLLDAATAAQLITTQTVTDFLGHWAVMYPLEA